MEDDKYRTLFNTINQGFHISELLYDEQGRVIDWRFLEVNPAFEQQTGLYQVVGQLGSVVATGTEDHWLRTYDLVVKTGEPIQLEEYHQATDRWYSLQATRVGEPASHQFAVIFTDITAQKRVDLQEKYRTLFNSMDEGFCVLKVVIDNTGQLIDLLVQEHNQAFERHTGRGTIVGKTVHQALPEFNAYWLAMASQVLNTGPSTRAENHLEALDRWYNTSFSMIGTGADPRITVVVEDITERKQAEIALRKSEEKFRTLFESVDEGFTINEIITDENDKVVDALYLDANEAFERHTGLKNVVGKKATDFVPHLEQHWLDAMTRVYKTGEQVRLEGYQADLQRWLTAHYSRVGEAGSPVYAVVFQDITERKQREQQQAFLLQLSDILRTHLTDTATLQQAALQLLAEQVDVMRAIYYEAEPDQDTFTLTARFERDAVPIPDQLRLSDFSPTVADAYRSGRTQLVTDTENEPFAEAYRAIGIRAWLAVPFVKEGRLIAVVGVHAKSPRSWTAIEIQLVEEFAERTWAAFERAKAEEALRQSNAYMNAILDVLPVGLAIADASGKIIRFNEALNRIWGVPPIPSSTADYAQWKGRFVDSGQTLAAQDWAMARTLTTGQPVAGDVVEIERFDGGRATIINAAAPIKDEQGHLIGGVVAELDITTQRATERALQQSEAQLRAIFQSAKDYAIFTTNLARQVTAWSRGAQAVFGYGEAAILHQICDVLYTEEDRQAGVPQGEARTALTEGEAQNERWHVRQDGSLFYGSGVVTPLRDETGSIVGLLKVLRDTTEQKRTQEALLQADRRKNEFLAMLAHELRNPLAPIRNGLQLLAQAQVDNPILATLLPIMNRQMDHIMRMMDDLLDVSRISRGKIELQKQRIDLTQVVAQSVDAMQPLYTASGRQLRAQLPDYPLYVAGDATRLNQVVSNLLTNGLRYTHEGGQVWLTLEPVGEQVQLRVADNGIGLAADQLEAIFELFVQVDTNLARSNGGLGLGLALVQQLVQLHGGRVEAHSGGLEQGSEFMVYLPILVV